MLLKATFAYLLAFKCTRMLSYYTWRKLQRSVSQHWGNFSFKDPVRCGTGFSFCLQPSIDIWYRTFSKPASKLLSYCPHLIAFPERAWHLQSEPKFQDTYLNWSKQNSESIWNFPNLFAQFRHAVAHLWALHGKRGNQLSTQPSTWASAHPLYRQWDSVSLFRILSADGPHSHRETVPIRCVHSFLLWPASAKQTIRVKNTLSMLHTSVLCKDRPKTRLNAFLPSSCKRALCKANEGLVFSPNVVRFPTRLAISTFQLDSLTRSWSGFSRTTQAVNPARCFSARQAHIHTRLSFPSSTSSLTTLGTTLRPRVTFLLLSSTSISVLNRIKSTPCPLFTPLDKTNQHKRKY